MAVQNVKNNWRSTNWLNWNEPREEVLIWRSAGGQWKCNETFDSNESFCLPKLCQPLFMWSSRCDHDSRDCSAKETTVRLQRGIMVFWWNLTNRMVGLIRKYASFSFRKKCQQDRNFRFVSTFIYPLLLPVVFKDKLVWKSLHFMLKTAIGCGNCILGTWMTASSKSYHSYQIKNSLGS